LNASQIDREFVLTVVGAPGCNYLAGKLRSCRQNNLAIRDEIVLKSDRKRRSYHIDRGNRL
jgi:hypothetical protein